MWSMIDIHSICIPDGSICRRLGCLIAELNDNNKIHKSNNISLQI